MENDQRTFLCVAFAYPISAVIQADEKQPHTPRLMESLGPGVVALHHAEHQVYITWRLLGTDPTDTALNFYRSSAALSW